MSIFILTWNPEAWEWDDLTFMRAVQQTAVGETLADKWSTGIRRSGIEPGDRAFLLRQRSDRGLIASGVFSSIIYEDLHWDGSGRLTTYARLNWDAVLEPEDVLPVDILKRQIPELAWDRMQGSGVQVPHEVESRLEDLWRDHLASVRRGDDRRYD